MKTAIKKTADKAIEEILGAAVTEYKKEIKDQIKKYIEINGNKTIAQFVK